MSKKVVQNLLHFVKQYVNNKYRVKIFCQNKGGHYEI